jgi:hypothetical protein
MILPIRFFRERSEEPIELPVPSLEPTMRILPFVSFVLVSGAGVLSAQGPGGAPPRTASDDTTVESGRLAIVHAKVESVAGNRFCVGSGNTLVLEIRQRGGSAAAPTIVAMSKGRDFGVEIVPVSADQLASGKPIQVRIEGVLIEPADREAGVITLGIREGAGTATEKSGKGLEIPIGRRTDWDVSCGRP